MRQSVQRRDHLDGFRFHPGHLDPDGQRALLAAVLDVVRQAPFFRPLMPRTGRPFTVRMTNCGPLGWVSDRTGYRYQPTHPLTGAPWPPIPDPVLGIWRRVSGYPHLPQACLVNLYREGAKLGLHRDADEADLGAPVVSVSLGDTAVFRLGGLERAGATRTLKLRSGDVLVLGGASRLAYHGIDRIHPGTSQLIDGGGRINLTLRRVTAP
jgi:alkylated DNA repair protein (DNA oxidative demethylase)